MVWNKSLLDTIGLQEYFTANRAKYNWEPRVGATLWSIDSDEKPAKIEKLLNKYIRKGLSNEEIKEKLDKVTLKSDVLKKYFPKSYTPQQMEEKIISLLEQWQKKRQQNKER